MRSVLSVSLPDKMAVELDFLAKETGRNKSDIVKESLGEFLWENRFRRIKKRLSPKAKEAGFITDEDVFKAIS
ncbi:MAG: ribbon-helix-helix protein, CopG family [Deltaproteobacteria bacterium]